MEEVWEVGYKKLPKDFRSWRTFIISLEQRSNLAKSSPKPDNFMKFFRTFAGVPLCARIDWFRKGDANVVLLWGIPKRTGTRYVLRCLKIYVASRTKSKSFWRCGRTWRRWVKIWKMWKKIRRKSKRFSNHFEKN